MEVILGCVVYVTHTATMLVFLWIKFSLGADLPRLPSRPSRRPHPRLPSRPSRPHPHLRPLNE